MNELLFIEVIALVFLGGAFFGASLKKSAAAFGYSMLGVSLFTLYVFHSGRVFAITQTFETLVVRLFYAEPLLFIGAPIAFVVGLTLGFRAG